MTNEIKNMTLSQLGDAYNEIMRATGGKEVKKFKDKSTAIARLTEAQKLVPTKTPAKKYDDSMKIVVTKDNKTPKDIKSAMAVIKQGVDDGYNTIGKAINNFKANWACPRSRKVNNYSFARGYVIGAIRENYISLK